MDNFNPKDFLLFALNHFGIKVTSSQEKIILLERGYAIEVEGQQLFKLLQDGQVIAPFADVEELCNFIKMDIQLNEEN